MTLVRQEASTLWELRTAWAARRWVVLTLTDRCVTQRVQGFVDHVAVTGAFVLVDGWHVPVVDITGVHRPHHTQEPNTTTPTGEDS